MGVGLKALSSWILPVNSGLHAHPDGQFIVPLLASGGDLARRLGPKGARPCAGHVPSHQEAGSVIKAQPSF